MSASDVINAAAFSKLPLVTQFDQVMRHYNAMIEHGGQTEKQFLRFVLHAEVCRKKWNRADERCAELQENLTKCEAEKNALIVKLKHARRQIDVEMEGRHKAEQDRDEFREQIMLVRELLFNNPESSSTQLSEEQQRKLDFLNASRFQSPRHGGASHRGERRLHPIDETGSIDYSDISFDITEDDLDCSNLRNGKTWKRSHAAARRRAFGEVDDETMPKRVKADVSEHESIRCTIEGPATMHIEKLEKSFSKPNPHQGRRRPSREHRRRSGTTSAATTSDSDAANIDIVPGFWPAPSARTVPIPRSKKQHNLQMKQCVIVKETCRPCGKRIQFSKRALKCSDCRLVAHPDCEEAAKNYACEINSPLPQEKVTIEDFLVSTDSPQLPPIIYHTVQEIERRGLKDEGLYRIPGTLRVVKELREKFKSNSIPKLADVVDVHALCSLVKEFLRVTLKEPILTFGLRPAFVRAANSGDESGLYQALSELPTPNHDTLVFLVLHFLRVVETPETRMTVSGLAKAIGPSIVGYATAEPTMAELQDAPKDQETVLTALLQLPADYYMSVFDKAMKVNNGDVPRTPDTNRAESMLGPIYSPRKTPSSSSLAERAKKYLHGTPFGKSKRREGYFQSPSLN